MINFTEFKLKNGLRVIHHKDESTPIVAVNVLYDVGARDEDESKTGFAHLFEHLMFGGSINIPDFDSPLQAVGGENNAFTSNDITNYYITIPKNNIETAFWLESDRMLSLAFTPKSLEVQRQVVIEEFKQRYLNQPYGDVFLLLRPLAYQSHPYKWATIGKEISHIEKASMDDVKSFFQEHYYPANAILSVAGDISVEELKTLCNKWFAPIKSLPKKIRNIPKEEPQKEERELTVERDVPLNALYMAYHMVGRKHEDYYATDLISDILSRGNSSRFYQKLQKSTEAFAEINCFITGDTDPGLFIISAKLSNGVAYDEALKLIENELNLLKNETVKSEELIKVKNKFEATYEFGKTSALNKAMALAISSLIDSPNLVNEELEHYSRVSSEDVLRVAKTLFKKQNRSILYYKSTQN